MTFFVRMKRLQERYEFLTELTAELNQRFRELVMEVSIAREENEETLNELMSIGDTDLTE